MTISSNAPTSSPPAPIHAAAPTGEASEPEKEPQEQQRHPCGTRVRSVHPLPSASRRRVDLGGRESRCRSLPPRTRGSPPPPHFSLASDGSFWSRDSISDTDQHLPRHGDHTHLPRPQLSKKRGIAIVATRRDSGPAPRSLLPPCLHPRQITPETLRHPRT